MILVRDMRNKYVGTIRGVDFMRYFRIQKLPPEYRTARIFEDFYHTESFVFKKMPKTKRKASLEIKYIESQGVFHERDCTGCPICEGV